MAIKLYLIITGIVTALISIYVPDSIDQIQNQLNILYKVLENVSTAAITSGS